MQVLEKTFQAVFENDEAVIDDGLSHAAMFSRWVWCVTIAGYATKRKKAK
jgi:hypothetical protein